MNPAVEPVWKRRLRAIGRLVLVYLAGLALLAWQPALLPRLIGPLLEGGGPRFGRLHLEATADANGFLQVRAESLRLERVQTRTHEGVAVAYDATLDGRLANRYLLLALTLLFAWPGLDRRTRLMALAPALLFVVACGTFDLLVQAYWQEYEMVGRSLASLRPPATEANEQLAADLSAYARRLQATKQFLSGGGRPFLAVVSFLAAVGLARPRKGI